MVDIEAPFEPFATALRAGGFGLPVNPAAWPAELVAAHLIMSSDLLTEAARAVHAGQVPTYDDAASSDGDALREMLIRTGSLPELADEVERSASDLRAAHDMLDARQLQTPLPAGIVHEGKAGTDGSRPLGELIEAHVGPHLQRHLTELVELRD